ncbi:GntR family transcriptional regulator [Corynebacterium uterequi]|uniref:Transcriptional regulator n=1 Tax=Corynebacterium uterequi TaxID=1072256 RepID=A0A0G3HH01_9CORY|nr:GntR family transcriptional regulator [Corynebacterium uterequi]AKK12060.1 transcriptional regulator [Corynebacterium uterequi]
MSPNDTSMLPAQAISDGPQPKHAQLRDILETMASTNLQPGDMLPGERVIEEFYGVSRITVRRAIGDLVASGRLRRVRGKGTFVAPNALVSRLHLASFSAEMNAQEVAASSRVLLSERATPPAEVVKFFHSAPDALHIHLRRLRLGDGVPYSIDDGWYNAAVAPGLLERDVYNSVYDILDKDFGHPVTDADQTVTAVAADLRSGPLLDVEVGAPLLHIVRTSRSGSAPVEWCSSVYRTDRYRLTSRIDRGVGV